METELFGCIARINKTLLIYHKENLGLNYIFSTRSQGELNSYPEAPLIYVWYYKWETNNIKHEVTFEIWKDLKWTLRSEHNTEERYDFDNPLKGEFLFEYIFETLEEMLFNIDKSKEEFFCNLQSLKTL